MMEDTDPGWTKKDFEALLQIELIRIAAARASTERRSVSYTPKGFIWKKAPGERRRLFSGGMPVPFIVPANAFVTEFMMKPRKPQAVYLQGTVRKAGSQIEILEGA